MSSASPNITRREALGIGAGLALAGTLSSAAAAASTPEPAPPPALPVPDHWRSAPRIALWPGSPPGAPSFKPAAPPPGWPESHRRAVAMPELCVFRPERPNGRSVLVMPGGAYWFVSVVNEGADLAPRLTARGYTVFVLTYRLPGEGWAARSDVPLQDAQRAMRLIRSRAGEYGIDPERIAALGFSAGGHLGATLATRHAENCYTAVDTLDALPARPVATGLIYPVITLQEPWTHQLSRDLLLGERAGRGAVNRRSAERHVDAGTTPLFLVHALDDMAVPVENSLRMLDAMRAARRPVEAHLLQEGGHAFGIGRPGTPSAQWIDLLCAWLERIS